MQNIQVTTTFVLVHGAFGNASVWGPLATDLALRGHRTVAVDLPGHGFHATIPQGYLGAQDLAALATAPSGMAGISTADDIAALAETVRAVAAHGPVVLVGTSRGGLAITAVARVVPELLARIVYLSAWCPVDSGVSVYETSQENATSMLADAAAILVGNPAELGALRLNWISSDPAHQDILQAAIMADGTREELLQFLRTQDPDESLVVDEVATRADAATWGRIPRTYVRLTEDRAMPIALQDRFIAEADALTPHNPFDVRSVASSHVGWTVRPGAVAEILDGLA